MPAGKEIRTPRRRWGVPLCLASGPCRITIDGVVPPSVHSSTLPPHPPSSGLLLCAPPIRVNAYCHHHHAHTHNTHSLLECACAYAPVPCDHYYIQYILLLVRFFPFLTMPDPSPPDKAPPPVLGWPWLNAPAAHSCLLLPLLRGPQPPPPGKPSPSPAATMIVSHRHTRASISSNPMVAESESHLQSDGAAAWCGGSAAAVPSSFAITSTDAS